MNPGLVLLEVNCVVVVYSAVLLGGIGFVFGLFLSFVSEKFKVEEDATVRLILEALPGINCGACGYPGCEAYAKAVAKGDKPDKCLPGKKSGVEEAIKEILSKNKKVSWNYNYILHLKEEIYEKFRIGSVLQVV